jgi:hypothetical protein
MNHRYCDPLTLLTSNLATLYAAIQPPKCQPACSTNAHCEYGLTDSKCVCNPGTSGNPYYGCGIQDKSDCSGTHCGVGAQCSAGPNAVECICPAGYAGNPYIQCYGKYTNPALLTKLAFSFVTKCFAMNTNNYRFTYATLTLEGVTAKTNYFERGKGKRKYIIKISCLVQSYIHYFFTFHCQGNDYRDFRAFPMFVKNIKSSFSQTIDFYRELRFIIITFKQNK